MNEVKLNNTEDERSESVAKLISNYFYNIKSNKIMNFATETLHLTQNISDATDSLRSSSASLNCAANFPSYHWPQGYKKSKFINKSYHVIVCEIHDDNHGIYYVAHTADAKGMSGEGTCIKTALQSLKKLMEWVAEEDSDNGGVYPDPSPLEYNIKDHKELEQYLTEDGVNVVNKSYHIITLFPIITEKV